MRHFKKKKSPEISNGLTESSFRKMFHYQLKHKHDRNGHRKIVIGDDLSERDMAKLGKTYVVV